MCARDKGESLQGASGGREARGARRRIAAHGEHAMPRVEHPTKQAADRWLVELYEELHTMARWHAARCPRRVTIRPRVLVHETYARLVTGPMKERGWNDKGRFLRDASVTMRGAVIDWAFKPPRHRLRTIRLTEEPELPVLRHLADRIEELKEALQLLQMHRPRRELVIRCRWFLGLTSVETAEAIGVDRRTVARDLRLAQAWLRAHLAEDSSASGAG